MAISMQKREENFKLSLTKKSILKIIACVGAAYDISGSMNSNYRRGLMDEFTARLMPLGLRFDDNGEIDNWMFNNGAKQNASITANNYEKFVSSEISSNVGGGTSFAPMLQDIYNYYFVGKTTQKTVKTGGFFSKSVTETIEEKPAAGDKPVYLIVQTDGDNDDRSRTDALLGQLEQKSIYIQFVGVGNDTTFSFIKEMGEKYSNVGFFHIPDLVSMSDEELYSNLINDEFKSFMQSKFPRYITVG